MRSWTVLVPFSLAALKQRHPTFDSLKQLKFSNTHGAARIKETCDASVNMEVETMVNFPAGNLNGRAIWWGLS